jgi:hypothetical protein
VAAATVVETAVEVHPPRFLPLSRTSKWPHKRLALIAAKRNAAGKVLMLQEQPLSFT